MVDAGEEMRSDVGEEIRLEMLRDVLKSYEAEHARLTDRWKALETKAQGTVAIAGIFLGGVFTFIRDLKADAPVAEPWLLVLVALLLTTAVFLSVLSLRVRGIADPMPGEEAERIAKDVVRLETVDIRLLAPALYGERFDVWREVNVCVRALVEAKARRLALAQGSLLTAVLLMCILSVIVVLTLYS